MKREHLTSFALVVGLLIAIGGPAQGADLLGINRPEADSVTTAKIILIDTATGTGVVVGDTTLMVESSTASGVVNTIFGPNGLAYDSSTGTAYFASIPGAGAASVLYSAVIDPPGPYGFNDRGSRRSYRQVDRCGVLWRQLLVHPCWLRRTAQGGFPFAETALDAGASLAAPAAGASFLLWRRHGQQCRSHVRAWQEVYRRPGPLLTIDLQAGTDAAILASYVEFGDPKSP